MDGQLIEALYGNAAQAGDWLPAMERFRILLGSSESALAVIDESASVFDVQTTGRILTPDVRRQYGELYGRFDPKLAILASRGPGYIFNDSDHFDECFVARDFFYQEYSRRLGTRHTLDMLVRQDAGRQIYLAAMRSRRAGAYGAECERLLRGVSGHFLRALLLREKLELLERAEDALDRLEFGVLVVDASRRVVLLNRMAEETLSAHRELQLRKSRLSARSGALCRKLDALVDAALAGRRDPGVLRVSNDRAGILTLWCLPICDDRRLSRATPAALVILGGVARRQPEHSDLAALYGLTSAELRVALAIAKGCTLHDIAAQRGVKCSTVRTQVLAILQKMGVHRQADVARVLSSVSVLPLR